MRKLFVWLGLLALLTSVGAMPTPNAAPDFQLTILHTSENHGHWEPVTVANVSQGGIARRATLIKKLRAENPNTLLLDSGDISMGTLYFVAYQMQEARDFYNLLGYDAVTLGNHEFDLGPKALADNFLSGAKFSIVSANVDYSREPRLAGRIPPHVVKTVGGEKIGIFGMVIDALPTSSNAGANIKMKDAAQTAKETVAELEKQGVNKIILLSHRGFADDRALAAQVDGVDVIVSGHTETLMGDAAKLDRSLGAPVAPYPTIVKSPNGGQVLIVHDFIWGRLLGKLDITFDDKGAITQFGGEPIFVDKNIADDPEVAQKLAELAKPLDDLKNQVIGKTTVDLEGDSRAIRTRETNLGNLVADAMLAATAMDKTQIAITNGGGIRTSIAAGDISYGKVLEVLPFGNRLVQFDLSGADVIAALENGLSQPGGGRFPQVAGLRLSADINKPAGARVVDVQIGDEKSGYAPLDKNATYRVVTNDFMANGGDGYEMFKRGTNVNGGDVPLDQAMSEFIRAHSPLTLRVEGRINLNGKPLPAPAVVQATRAPTITLQIPLLPLLPEITAAPPPVLPYPAPYPAPIQLPTAVAYPATYPTPGDAGLTWISIIVILLLATGAFLIARGRG
jgi:5'-nucleotidase